MDSPHITLDTRISSALEQSPWLGRRKLRVETSEGNVVLRGRVTSYFQKQMAQETIKHIEGISAIDNQLEVHWVS